MINIKIDKDWIPFIAIAVLIFILIDKCTSNDTLREDIKELKQTVSIADNNLEASKDSVRTYVNKAGFLESEIRTFKYTNTQLVENNGALTKKYRAALGLNKKLQGVNTLLQAELNVKDSLLLSAQINPDSTFTFNDSANFGDNNIRIVRLDGKINESSVTGNLSIYQTISLLGVIEKKDGVSQLKISTKYPFDDIKLQGIEVINEELNTYKNKSRWVVNAGIGYGIIPLNGGLRLSPVIGISLGYSPKWLQF